MLLRGGGCTIHLFLQMVPLRATTGLCKLACVRPCRGTTLLFGLGLIAGHCFSEPHTPEECGPGEQASGEGRQAERKQSRAKRCWRDEMCVCVASSGG
ncbi:hypothetical protein MPTK1_4g16410 [Marchantia polymorpha subsp. ruderalis]|uniref:Uncharacterized protein n=2 Tax=Marchantia polymorpha TaxID=3197 RepID=A0AAF6BAI2_MARPO|nr:hypothetical protein MARPO_0054s0106 [Marchantia polymorpha]BBN09016.1 hypothetical protein Mp_4g16410 [Marchantia polymorpha subsp. ruderalis]|eukprot:PTQ38005.1 hypothetical protein MARPO_0054s0106 [Marchantia polymorpha]